MFCRISSAIFFIVGMGGYVPVHKHLHPDVTICDQASAESLTNRVTRIDNALDTLPDEIVLQSIPTQFISELERLYQTLIFQI